jgi:hypothetical protein
MGAELLVLVTFSVSSHSAFAPVNSQATNFLNPGKTFFLPPQNVGGVQ